MPRTKKGRWSLKRFRFGFNVLLAKGEAEFEKNEIPRKPTRKQRAKLEKNVETGLSRITEQAGQPKNVVASTFSQLADKELWKAIRSGDWGTAIVSSIIKYYADEASKNQPTSYWSS